MNLEINTIKDIKEWGLKLPARKVLKELSTLEIMYLHFSAVDDGMGGMDLMSYKMFVKSLTDNFGKNQVKKMPREELISDLVQVFDGYISLGKIMSKNNSTYVEKVYTALAGLFLEDYNENMLKSDLSGFKDGLSKSVLKLLMWINEFNENGCSNEDMGVLIDKSKPIISKAYFNMLDTYHYENEDLNEKLSNFETIWEKRLNEKENKMNKMKEINKKLNKEVDVLKKSLAKESKDKNENKAIDNNSVTLENSSEIFEIKKMLNSLSEQSKKGFEELMSSKNDVMRASYERQIDKLNGMVSDLKANLKIKAKEIKDLENLISIQKSDISKLNKEIDAYSEKTEMLSEAAIEVESSLDEIKNVKELEDIRHRRCVYVGYVEISEGSHFVIDSNGKRNKIINMKDNTYVADGQFVVCTDEHEFMFASPSFIDKNNIMDNVKFGIVVNANPIKIEVNGLVEHNIAYHQGTILKKGQVVAVRNGFLVKAYKTQKLSLDQLLEPIKMTGQDVYFIVNAYGEHLIARDVETNEEIILSNSSESFAKAQKKDIVCVKDNKIVNVINSKYWYTNSEFYSDRIQFGPIEKKDGLVYIRKNNGEFIVVGDIHPIAYDKIADGDVIAVDEFDDYLYKVDTENSYIDRASYSAIKKSASQSMTAEKSAYELKGKVAIIGSYKARESYIKYFRERGYDVQFIYGYEKNPTRVVNKCKDCEAVICDASHMGHHIQEKIKDRNFTGFSDDVLVGFAEAHGASSAFKELERLKNI